MSLLISSLYFLFISGTIFPMGQPTPLQLQIKVTPPTCPGMCNGLVDLTVSGGQPGYTYSWSNGLTTEDYPNACAGTGEVTVHDASGNSATTSFTVKDPTPMVIDKLMVKQPTPGLSNGSIEVSVSGGILPYRFTLDGINYSTSNVFSNLGPDLYVIGIHDTKGCLVQSTTISLQSVSDVKALNSFYHLSRNEETNVIHLYSNIALSVQLMDAQGRIMMEEGLSKGHDFPLGDMDYGVYILKISDGVRSSFEKIVKSVSN
jgi:hypothetical protein